MTLDIATATAAELTCAIRDRQLSSQQLLEELLAWADFFGRYDVVLVPVMPVAAFPHDTDAPFDRRMLDVDGVTVPHHLAAAWVCAIGVMLLPVVTLPVGLTESGLPVGVQVVGPFLSDLRLLRIAELLDAAAGPGFSPPPGG